MQKNVQIEKGKKERVQRGEVGLQSSRAVEKTGGRTSRRTDRWTPEERSVKSVSGWEKSKKKGGATRRREEREEREEIEDGKVSKREGDDEVWRMVRRWGCVGWRSDEVEVV